MAIDIRATVTCSLGTLISGSISDDYLQGSGLVKTRGSCEISGLITPAMGDVVTFSYTKGGATRTIPRKLRVLSSFADPFRRTTKVELGCKLTYLSDLQESVKWTAFDDNANNDFTEDDQRIITLPISAASAMAKCLTELGITASSSPLTNKFSIAEFDFSAGYVQVLSDLLVSESFFGYLDTNEVLQVRSLNQDGGTGPALTSADIVDVGPIGVGQLPGEAVTVSYSSLKLKAPEISFTVSNDEEEVDEEQVKEIQRINWELDETREAPQSYYVSYKLNQTGPLLTNVYSGISSSVTFTTYDDLTFIDPETGEVETREVVVKRIVRNTGPSISIAMPFAQQRSEAGLVYANENIITSQLETFYSYSSDGASVSETTDKYITLAELASAIGVPLVYDTSDSNFKVTVEPNYRLILSEQTRVATETIKGVSKRATSTYKLIGLTQRGQQAIASATPYVDEIDEALAIIDFNVESYAHDNTTVQVQQSGSTTDVIETRPKPADRVLQTYSGGGGNPNNGWRTESKAQLELALGSATAQRRIEFSMPYAPDDVFTKLQTGGGFNAVFTLYSSIASDAPAKANRYGRVQNRLLLGNRSGVNLQVAPERMPAAPFDPIFVQAAGLTALYRVNGNQWAFDSNGIVCSTDALYWGVAGKNS